MQSHLMDLSVLIVSYNTREKTLACLRSIERETSGLDYEVLVLDNASGDGSADAVRAEFPSLFLDVQPENLGFARGINRLATQARGEFLLLLNPDTEIRDGAIQELVAFARENPAPGIFGGRTIRPDGIPHSDFAWGRATVWSTLANATGLARLLPRSRLFNPEGVSWRIGDGAHPVDIVSGCFLLIHRTLWQELGGFDPSFFVYGEEADLCLRAHARGVRPRVTSRAVVMHHCGASEVSQISKQTKLLAAKARLMRIHWRARRARWGTRVLGCHALLRAGGFTALAWVRPARFAVRAREWRSIWREREGWLGVAPPQSSAISEPRKEPALR